MISGLQQSRRLVGPWCAGLRNGSRLPALLRRSTHPDLRENRLRKGKFILIPLLEGPLKVVHGTRPS